MTWDTATINENNTGVTGFNFNHTIGAGIKRWARVMIWGGGSGLVVSGTPTFGGVAMTPVSGSPYNMSPLFSDLYFYDVLNPATGVNAVVGNFTGTVQATIIVISRDEVNQTTPCDATDTDTTAEDVGDTTATTASEVGDQVVDIVATGGVSGGGNYIEGAGQTELAQSFNSGELHAVALSYKDGATSVTQTWDIFGAISDITSLYHFQFNVNTDAAAPLPDTTFDPLRTYRPRPFCPGSIR